MILPLFIPISVTINRSSHFLILSSQLIFKTSCICIFISFISVMSNLLDYLISGYEGGLSGPSLMCIFFTGLILFSSLNITGVLRKMPNTFYYSFFIWLPVVVFWFVIVGLLYSDWAKMPELCINHRCPDSLWLHDWYWQSHKEAENMTTTRQPATNVSEIMTTTRHTAIKVSEIMTTTRYTRYTTDDYIGEDANDYQPASNSTSSSLNFENNFWYSLGSMLACFSFAIYLALLGGHIWAHCNVFYTIKRADQGAPVTPGGYLYVVELRRRNIQEGESGAAANPQTSQAP